MIKALLSVCPFLFSIAAHGVTLEKSYPFKQTVCELGKAKTTLLLRFDRKIDAAENDFSGAPMVFLKSRKTHTLEPLAKPHPGDFSFVAPKEKSACADTQAYPLDQNSLAILYSKDNRPFQALYEVAAWNSQADQILDKRELGAVSDTFKTEQGFAFATLVPRSDVDQIEMTSTSGRKMSATDKDLGALRVASLRKNKLHIEFDPKLSYDRSPWKKFFKSEDDFLKTAGWDPKTKAFTNTVVYEATHFNRKENDMQESCIALADKRGGNLDRSGWRCLQEKQ